MVCSGLKRRANVDHATEVDHSPRPHYRTVSAMFIKKDTRKIDEILIDEEDDRERLLLARRENEFKGNSAAFIFQQKYINSFKNLVNLSLYGNKLNDLSGISIALKESPVSEINLGRNICTDLPAEFEQIKTLKTLWLDDNLLVKIPECICKMKSIECLRLSGNKISSVTSDISNLSNLRIFTVDRNEISVLPDTLTDLKCLRILDARGNQLEELPKRIQGLSNLEVLQISSNRLKKLPNDFSGMDKLQKVYAGSNQIVEIPESMASLKSLKFVSLVNNDISEVNETVYQHWFDQENAKPKDYINLKGNKCIKGSRRLSQQPGSARKKRVKGN